MSDRLIFAAEPLKHEPKVLRSNHGYLLKKLSVQRADRPAYTIMSAWHGTKSLGLHEDGALAREACQTHFEANPPAPDAQAASTEAG